MLFKNNNKKIKGFALFELIIAIGILGGITTAVISLATRSITASNAHSLTRHLSEITIGIKSVFKGDYRLPGLLPVSDELPEILVQFGVIDHDTLSNPLVGDIEFKLASVNGQPKQGVFLIVSNIAIENCLTLTKQLFNGVEFLKIAPVFSARSIDSDLVIRNPRPENGYLKTLNGGQVYSIEHAMEACDRASYNIDMIIGTR